MMKIVTNTKSISYGKKKKDSSLPCQTGILKLWHRPKDISRCSGAHAHISIIIAIGTMLIIHKLSPTLHEAVKPIIKSDTFLDNLTIY
jgi:hypothetical protein